MRWSGSAFLSDGGGRRRDAGWSDWLAELARHRRATRLDGRRHGALDRGGAPAAVPALWPRPRSQPAIAAPAAVLPRDEWSRDEALVEILRGRLEGLGPATAETPRGSARARARARSPSRWRRSKPKASPCAGASRRDAGSRSEWCERRLLARIHRYTVKRLRAEIEPVAARDFLRFLFGWQRVAPTRAWRGRDAVDAVVGQLEGFEAPAGAWESEILPARLAGYEPAWLDDRCLAGRVAWTRLRRARRRDASTAERGGAPVRTTPITLLARRHAALWASLVDRGRRAQSERTRAGGRSITFARMAPRSSTSSWTAPACCDRRSRRRWPNWWRSAS